MRRRILILGGTGVFGRRLAKHLGKSKAEMQDADVIITSRNRGRASKVADALKQIYPTFNITGIALDHQRGLEQALVDLKPFVVVDCSGPFQNATFGVAKAALASGAHLIDLADARDYLKQFGRVTNSIARENQVCGFTGASSTPTLSGCVVRQLTKGWHRIDTIDVCITPGGKSEVGRSVIGATMSYAGKKITIWKHGALAQTTGWGSSHVIDVPGLGRRRVAPVETLDAELLGQSYNVQSHVSFSAGLESRLEQWGLEAMARLHKSHLFPNTSHLTSVFLKLRKLTKTFTSDRGGMVVDIAGVNSSGTYERAQWTLLAQNGDGPFVPVLPAAALIRKLLTSKIPSGARYGFENLSLGEIEPELEHHSIQTSEQRVSVTQNIFEGSLGAAKFKAMPKVIQQFHGATGPVLWQGKADVVTGRGVLRSLINRLFGLPREGRSVPVTVAVDRAWCGDPTSEKWVRCFDGRIFHSVLSLRKDGAFIERFAPFSFVIGLNADEKGLEMPVNRWSIGRLPLPKFLAPKSQAHEFEDDQGRFNFDVKITLPIVGLLAHYRGSLTAASHFLIS